MPTKMNITIIYLVLVLCLCVSVHCLIFNDATTVTKARCYANCLTLVSKQGLNDSRCESEQCLKCKQPCDQKFVPLDSCIQSCNSSICNSSCSFIKLMKNWTNIFDGSKELLNPPGVAIATARNISQFTLSWQPPVNASGTVVYLLKMTYDGDVKPIAIFSPFPLLFRGSVFLDSKTIFTSSDVCSKVSTWRRRSFNGINFYFTVVSLTEHSIIVEGQLSAAITFPKADPLSNAVIDVTFDKKKDQVTLQVFPARLLGIFNVFTHYQVQLVDPRNNLLLPHEVPISKNVTFSFIKNTPSSNMTITIYFLINSCLTSKPKKMVYQYKGCHSVENFDRQSCCKIEPEKGPISGRQVSNLTYSPLQITDDFRFNTQFTWLPPTHSCPEVEKYKLRYGDANKYFPWSLSKTWRSSGIATITNTNFNLTNIKPGLQMKFVIEPLFGVSDVGVSREILFNTTVIPVNKTSIHTVRHVISPYSISRRFTVNISWIKPVFNYSLITSYNVTYLAQGDVPKTKNVTNNLWFMVGGLDYGQALSYQVKPVYRDSWIITKKSNEQTLKLPVPKEDEIKVKSLHQSVFIENSAQNLYSVSFAWTRPRLNRTVSYYDVSSTLRGYLDEFDCPGNKRCLSPNTNGTYYTLTGIRPKESVIIKVRPVFAATKFFVGKQIEFKKIHAPDPKENLIKVQNLTYHEIHSSTAYNITWAKPLFKHSAVLYYEISYELTNQTNTRKRRATKQDIRLSAATKHFLRPKLDKGQELTFKIAPKFKEPLITGAKVFLKIKYVGDSHTSGLSKAEIAGLVIGLLFLLVLLLLIAYLLCKRSNPAGMHPTQPGGRLFEFDHWEVFEDKLRLLEVIGEGAFGKVYKAILVDSPGQSRISRRRSTITAQGELIVAVKTLLDTPTEEQRIEFLKEIQLMKDVGSHRNVVKMLGCGTLSDPMFLIVEYLPNGDLLHYLRERRGKAKQHSVDPRGPYHSSYYWTHRNQQNNNSYDDDNYLKPVDSTGDDNSKYNEGFFSEDKQDSIQLVSVKDIRLDKNDPSSQHKANNPEDFVVLDEDILTSGDLMAFAWQVAQGMEYLAKRGYVHRDLAARNVLVGENKEAKIADFGLTRHMYKDLYTTKTNRRLPIKWMSIEAIFDQNFTAQSDVWSYGVFLWELVTLGGTPYPTKSNRELLKCLREGYRMERPDTCDDEVYNIMMRSWEERPEDRPTFNTITLELEEMMMRDNPYFDPSSIDESRDYYNFPSFKSIEDSNDLDNVFEEILGGTQVDDEDEGVAEKKNTEADTEAMNGTIPGHDINVSENGRKEGGVEEHNNTEVAYTEVVFKTMNGSVEQMSEKETNMDSKTNDLHQLNGAVNQKSETEVDFKALNGAERSETEVDFKALNGAVNQRSKIEVDFKALNGAVNQRPETEVDFKALNGAVNQRSETEVDFKALNGAVQQRSEEETNVEKDKTTDIHELVNGNLSKTSYDYVHCV